MLYTQNSHAAHIFTAKVKSEQHFAIISKHCSILLYLSAMIGLPSHSVFTACSDPSPLKNFICSSSVSSELSEYNVTWK